MPRRGAELVVQQLQFYEGWLSASGFDVRAVYMEAYGYQTQESKRHLGSSSVFDYRSAFLRCVRRFLEEAI